MAASAGAAPALLRKSAAARLVRRRLVTLEARRPVAEIHRGERRHWVGRRTVPFLVQFHEGAIELHALDRLLDLVAVLAALGPEGEAEVAPVEILEAALHRPILARRIDCGRDLVQGREGASGDDRLHRVRERVVALDLEAEALGVGRR